MAPGIGKLRRIPLGWVYLADLFNLLYIFLITSALAKPIGIVYIIVCYTVNFPVDHLLWNGFDFLCGNTGIYASFFANGAFQYHCARGNYGVTLNNRFIHNNSSHSDQYVIM